MRGVFGFNLLFEYVTIGFVMSGSWTLILEICNAGCRSDELFR